MIEKDIIKKISSLLKDLQEKTNEQHRIDGIVSAYIAQSRLLSSQCDDIRRQISDLQEEFSRQPPAFVDDSE